MENKFVKESKEAIEKLIDDWKVEHKPVLSNYYGLATGFDYDYQIVDSTIVVRKKEGDFYRLFVLSTDATELTTILSCLQEEHVINIPSRKPIDDWQAVMKDSGFEYYSTYSRYCNTKIATMKKHKTTLNIHATIENAEEIYQLLTETFSPYTGHLPSKEELEEMILNQQVLVDKYSDGHVCGVNIHTITGVTGYGNAWVDKGEHAVELLLDMYNEMIEKGVKRHVFWVNDANTGVAKMHIKMGAKPDGLKDYTYIKNKK